MERIVQFTGPRQVEVAEHASAPLPTGPSSGAHPLLGHLRGHRTHRVPRHQPLPDPHLGRRGHGSSATVRPASTYPVVGWGYSEVGEVIEVSPELDGTPGLPAVGDLVWGIWGHRSEGVVPVERMIGHRLPEGVEPARRDLRPGRRHRVQRGARRRHPPRRGRRRLRPGRHRPAHHPARAAQRRPRHRRRRPGRPARRPRAPTAPSTTLNARSGAVAEDDPRGHRRPRRRRAPSRSAASTRPCTRRSARSPSAAGSSPPASTRATASDCGSATSSTTTGSS